MSDQKPEDHVATPIEALADAMDSMMAADLAFLRMEMEALTHLLPGAHPPGQGATPETDAEIESNFDNMPV